MTRHTDDYSNASWTDRGVWPFDWLEDAFFLLTDRLL